MHAAYQDPPRGSPAPTVMRARAGWLAWGLWGLNLALWALFLSLWAVRDFDPPPGSGAEGATYWLFERTVQVLAFMVSATIGALVAARHPANPIGWIICAGSAFAAFEFSAFEYGTLATVLRRFEGPLPGVVPVAWLATWLTAFNAALYVPLLLLFPDGRLASPRWRWLLATAALLALMVGVGAAFRPGPLLYAPGFANPFGLPEAAEGLALIRRVAIVWGLPLAGLLAAFSLWFRLYRSRGDQRRQLQWVAYAALLYWLVITATTHAPLEWSSRLGLVYVLAHAGFVLALGLAVLKYRLYDVELVVNKAIVYASLALGVTAAYVGVVVGIGALIGTQGEPNLALSLLATAVVAVAFQPLRERLQRLANRLVYGHRATPYEVLTDFSRGMASALGADELLPRLAEVAARGVSAARGQVRVFVPGGPDRVAAWPPGAAPTEPAHTLPVQHQGELVGEIGVSKPPTEPLTPTERALLVDLADQAAVAFGNLRLSLELEARLRAEAEHRGRELEVLYTADEALYHTLQVTNVLQALVDVGADLLRADKAHVMVWNERREKLVVGAQRGFSPEGLALMAFAPGRSLSTHVAVTGEAEVVEDAQADPRTAREVVEVEGIRSMMRVPLVVEGQVFGVFGVSYGRAHVFSPEEKRLVLALGRRAALAIENARLYEQAQQAAALEERQRLARELHDSATQSMYSARMYTEAALRLLDRGDAVTAAEYLREVKDAARDALAEMRLLIYELRPPLLETEGLASALRARLELVEARAGVQVEFSLEPPGAERLPAPLEQELYRVGQEALNNALKHARPNRVVVTLQRDSLRTVLEIADDGAGFDPAAVAGDGRAGLGLKGMQERMARLGGDLTIESQPGQGTRVRACVPA